MAPRRKALRIVLALLLVGALPCAWIGSLFLDARRTLDAHRQECRAFLESFPPESAERPAIFHPAEPGDAWSLEVQALEKITGTTLLPEDDLPMIHRLVSFALRWVNVGENEDLALKAEAAVPHLGLLRAALRQERATPAKRPGWQLLSATQEALDVLRHHVPQLHARGRDLEAFERMVLSVGLAQDIARHGDLEHRSLLLRAEGRCALAAKEILSSHSLSALELETVASWLDRLAAARPPLARTMAVENALERVFVSDPTFGFVGSHNDPLRPTSPTWRELWSPLLHDAKRVTTLRRVADTLADIPAMPVWEREAAVRKRLAAMDLEVCQPWELPAPIVFQHDARGLTSMAALRLAVAVAWHEAERASPPPAWEALVPRHIPSTPPCPLTGLPFRLETGGFVFDLPAAETLPDEDEMEFPKEFSNWRIGRRKK